MEQQKVFALLGFAQRSGQIVSGVNQVESHIKNKKIELVIVATDASKQIAEDLLLKCQFHGVEAIQFGQKMELGLAIGKSPRTVIGISNREFAMQIKKYLE
ncbi:ribosomal protein L7Ae-like RNA K-turn-binding protein [Desulfitispora alkaliphila]|uniref:L7Ae/L30e/S12e/Gadd45 family ribosomal protein n=1 Tax=Desulfitispora alkaliphila TaxID=622674 RepID=UPI003D1EBB53